MNAQVFAGSKPSAPWALFAQAVARSNSVLDAVASWDELSVTPSRETGERFSLRWIVVHLVEEYARHAGHADLIRESIDGVVGR